MGSFEGGLVARKFASKRAERVRRPPLKAGAMPKWVMSNRKGKEYA